MTKFIGIISAKGGVGKTTAAINLTSALHFFNRSVIAMDANFANPDMGMHLGLYKPEKTLHSALREEHHIKHAIHRHPSGLLVIPGSISYDLAKTVRRESLLSVIGNLSNAAEAVIIDSAPGTGEDTRSVIRACDYLIIVTTPDFISVTDSLRIVRLAREMRKRVLGVVVNRQAGEDYEMSVQNIAEYLDTAVIGIIPEDAKLRRIHRERMPLVLADPNNPASLGYKKLAGRLIGEEYVEQVKQPEELSTFRQIMKNLGF